MKKVIAIALTFIIIFSNCTYNVSAAVTKGGKLDVLNSEYVVIVNTSSSDSQSTGKIICFTFYFLKHFSFFRLRTFYF